MVSNFDNNSKKKGINHQGNLNPMYGKRHSEESKQKISQSQKERYNQYKKAINGIYHATMDELLQSESFDNRLRQIIREEAMKLL